MTNRPTHPSIVSGSSSLGSGSPTGGLIGSHRGSLLATDASVAGVGAADPSVVATKQCALTLYRPSREHFMTYNGPAMDSLGIQHDLSAILRDFHKKPERTIWLSNTENERAISHFIGDIFAKGSYPGWDSQSAMKGLQTMLSFYVEGLAVGSKLKNSLENFLSILTQSLASSQTPAIDARAASIAAKMKAMSVGETLLISAGYKGNPGHATMVKFTKAAEATFSSPAKWNVSEINTGAGADIAGCITKDVVHRRFRQFGFSGVPETTILTGVNSASWLRALLEPKDNTATNQHNYDMDYIHKVIFTPLAPYFQTDRSPFFSGQISGTCAMQCLMATLQLYLHSEGFDKDDYKIFATWQKSRVLLTIYSHWLKALSGTGEPFLSPDTMLDEQMDDFSALPSHQIRLLTLASNELEHHVRGRLLKHVASKSAIPLEYSQAFCISHVIKKFLQRLHDYFALSPLALNQVDFDHPVDKATTASIIAFQAAANHPTLKKYEPSSSSVIFELPRLDVSDIERSLGDILTRSLETKVSLEQEHIVLCRWVIESLPSLSECLKYPSTINSLQLISCLNGIIVKRCLQIGDLPDVPWTSPWAAAASSKLLCIAHNMACQLCTRLDGGLFSQQKFINLPRYFFEDRYALLLDPTLKDTFEETALYWDAFSQKDFFEKQYYKFSLSDKSAHPQVQFWHQWLEKIPGETRAAYSLYGEASRLVFNLMTKNNASTDRNHPASAIVFFKHIFHLNTLLSTTRIRAIHLIQNNDWATFYLTPCENSEYSYSVSISCHALNDADKDRSKTTFVTLPKNYDKLVERKEFSRSTHQTENASILSAERSSDAEQGIDPLFTLALKRGQAEPLQNAPLLLFYFADRLDRLKDINLRNTFLLSFFKTTLVPQEAFLHALSENLESKSFVQRLQSFFHEAFTFYIDRQSGGEADHDVCIFLSKLAVCCRYIASRNHDKEDVLEHIAPLADAYLSTKVTKDSPEDTQLNAHLLTVLTSLLLRSGKRNGVQALSNWIAYNGLKTRQNPGKREIWLQHLVSVEYAQALPSILDSTSLEDLHSIASQRFGNYMDPLYNPSQWKKVGEDTSTYRASLPHTSNYLIMDFSKGTLANESGILSSGERPSWFIDSLFTDIFGQVAPIYTLAGQSCLISHKERSFQVFFITTEMAKWHKSFQILHSGEWLYYAPANELLEAVPDTLARRYWWFFDKKANTLIGFSRDTFEKRATIEASEGAIVGESRKISKISTDLTSHGLDLNLVAEIELPKFVELEEDIRSGSKAMILSRFQLWGGEKLQFIEEESKWVYSLSRGYHLDTDKEQPSLLGGIKTYVSLINKKNKRLILVPVCNWTNQAKALGSNFVPDIHRVELNESSLLDGTVHLMEYHVDDDGRLIGGNFEAKLYLSLLFVLQKKIVDAFNLVKALSPTDFSTETETELVKEMVRHGRQNPDFGPDSVAYWMMFFSKVSKTLEKLIEKEREQMLGHSSTFDWINSIYTQYVQSFARVEKNLQLPGKSEIELLRSLLSENPAASSRASILHAGQGATSSAETTTSMISTTESRREYYLSLDYQSDIPLSTEPVSLPALTVPFEKRYAILSQRQAQLCLLALERSTDQESIERLKLFMQTQSTIGATSLDFLRLLELCIYLGQEKRSRGALPYFEGSSSFFEHLAIAAGTQRMPLTAIANESYWELESRKATFRRNFSIIATLAYEKFARYIPKTITLNRTEASLIDTPKPVYGAHFIDWYKSPDLHAALRAQGVLKQAIPDSEMAQLFSLTPLTELDLQETKALGKARHEIEKAAIAKENELFLEDLMAGKRKIEERFKVKPLDDKFSVFAARNQVAIEGLEQSAQDLETSICQTLNKLPQGNSPALLAEIAARDTGKKIVYGTKEAVFLFLKGHSADFLEANPLLSSSEINQLMVDISTWLMLKTDFQHLRRIETLQKDYEKHKDDITGDYYAEMLYTTCVSKREYDPRLHPELLVFEYLSQMRLRPQQVQLIDQLLNGQQKYDDAVAQLIMGGGKTSVLATVLLVLAAEKGLAIFVTPASQFATVRENLAQSMRQCFNRELLPLTIERSELTTGKVKELILTFNEARRLGTVIITKPETLQLLELEFITLSRRYSESVLAGITPTQDELELLHGLAKIGEFLQQQGMALIDEVDLVLDTMKEVNFPGGVVNTMTPDRVEVMLQIFTIMADPTVSITPPDQSPRPITEFLRVTEILQEEFNVDFFKTTVVPVIARALVLRAPFMKLAEHEEAFVEYASGKLKKPLSTSQQTFLDYMDNLSKSSANADVQAANQIALAKHIFQDVLTTALTRGCGRNFGRTRGHPAGKVVPYQGVDTPSASEFGYHVEAACYQFLTALQTGIQDVQIEQLAKVMTECATKSANFYSKPFDQTPEAIEFKEITGIDLHTAKLPDKLKEAVAKLEDERLRGIYINILGIEAETILTCVNFHANRVSSGPQSFLSMFASRRAFSGTPWNVETYPLSMSNPRSYLKDLGTEGQIVATLLDRENKSTASMLHGVAKADPVEMIRTVMAQYGDPTRVSMLLDPCGMFKGQDNKQIARAVRDFIATDPAASKKFKGVLFFTRPPKSQTARLFSPAASEGKSSGVEEDGLASPDTLAFLPMGSNTIKYLKGTSVSELAEHDLHPGDYFVIDDERHTTGTDIRMSPDAVAVMTMDETLTKPRMCQAVMRLRQYLYTQELHAVILNSTLEKLEIEDPRMSDLISLSNRAQALQKSRIMTRSFNQKIDNIFRLEALKLIRQKALEQVSDTLARVTQAMIPFTTYNVVDEPYDLFKGVDEEVETIKHLESRFDARLTLFRKALDLTQQTTSVDWEAIKAGLLGEARACDFLPIKEKVSSATTGVEQEVQLLVQEVAEVAVDLSIQNEQQILMDLQQLNKAVPYGEYKESPWSEAIAARFISTRQSENANTQGSHPAALKSYIRLFLEEGSTSACLRKYGFEHAISPNLMCTTNFQYTATNPLPLFHAKLRPANRMLLVKRFDGSFGGVLLSLKEADFFERYITKHKTADTWLVDASGAAIGDPASPVPLDQDGVNLLLLQMNAIEGNIDYINKKKSVALLWLGSHIKNKIDFVKFAVISRNDPFQRRQFVESEIFNIDQANRLSQQRSRLRAHRLFKLGNAISPVAIRAMKEQEVKQLDSDDVGLVNPDQVNWLLPNQIQSLRTLEQIQALNADNVGYVNESMVRYLTPAQIPYLGKDTSKIARLTPEQVNNLTPDQVPLLKNTLVASLTKPELIQALGENVKHIQANQVQYLLPTQMKNVPATASLIQSIKDVRLLDAASEAQLDLLAVDQLPLITNPTTVSKLGAAHINTLERSLVKYLRREQAIQALDQTGVNALQANQLPQLKEEQIGLITNNQLILSIYVPEVLSRLNLSLFGRFLEAKQLNLLPVASIAELPSETQILEKLDAERFAAITPSQIQSLETKVVVTRLNKTQLKSISRIQFPLLSQQQISDLEGDAINAIEPSLVNSLRPEQIAYLRERALIQALEGARVNHICPDVVLMLTQDQIKNLTQASLIEKLSEQDLSHLSDEGFAQISQEQLSQIRPESPLITRIKGKQVQHLNEAVVSVLTQEDLLEHLLDGQIQHLSRAMFLKLPQTKIESIKEQDLLDRLSDEQLAYLKDSQLTYASDALLMRLKARLGALLEDRIKEIKDVALTEYLSEAQLEHLNHNVIKNIQSPVIIKKLGAKQIPHLESSQLSHLTENQLQHLNVDQIPLLKEPQVRQLPAELAKHLKTTQSKWASDKCIPHLSDSTVNGVLPEKTTLLTDGQFSALTKEDLIKAVPDKKVDHLSPAVIKHLTESQLGHLSKKESIEAVEADETRLSHLNDSALSHLTQAQILSITSAALLDRLPEACLDRLTPSQVKKLHLKAQISLLKEEQVNQIDVSCIGHLSDRQINLLTEQTLIQALSVDKLKIVKDFGKSCSTHQLHEFFDQGYADLIPKDRFDEIFDDITEDQLGKLSATHIPYLTKLSSLQKLKDEHLQHLKTEQVIAASADKDLAWRLPTTKLQHVPAQNVNLLSDDQLKNLSNQTQVQAISLDRIAAVLSRGNLNVLSEAQVATITEKTWIQRLKPEMTRFLLPKEWPNLTGDQSKGFMNQILSIRSDLISQIPASFFQNIPANALNNPEFMSVTTTQQREQIPTAVISNLTDKDTLAHLMKEHMPYIPANLVQFVKGDHVAYVNQTELGSISQKQVHSITGAEAINALYKKDSSFLGRFTDKQLEQIDQANSIEEIDEDRRFHLKKEVIQKLSILKLWSQPAAVLKKTSAVQKIVLFTGLFVQSIVLSLMSSLLTLIVGLFAFIRPARTFIKESWRLTAYSWRCFKIF